MDNVVENKAAAAAAAAAAATPTNVYISKDSTWRPFDWLTSSESVLPIIESLNLSNKVALHLGCGSSTLGESLVKELDFQFVLNVDKDPIILERMRQRWDYLCNHSNNTTTPTTARTPSTSTDSIVVPNSPPPPPQQQQHFHCNRNDALQYQVLDFDSLNLQFDNTFIQHSHSPYPLIVEKSTLDCTLCNDIDATVGLLTLVYQHLAPKGYYVLISFRSLSLLIPLLQDLPGATWTIVQVVELPRHVHKESLGSMTALKRNNNNNNSSSNDDDDDNDNDDTRDMGVSQVPDTSNTTQSIHAIVCQNNDAVNKSTTWDMDAVRNHVISIMDAWYQTLHPLLNESRRHDIEKAFLAKPTLDNHHVMTEKKDDKDDAKIGLQTTSNNTNNKSLSECYYSILFTDDERQDLTFEHFLEDWNAYRSNHPNLPANEMSLTTALDFLQEMQ